MEHFCEKSYLLKGFYLTPQLPALTLLEIKLIKFFDLSMSQMIIVENVINAYANSVRPPLQT